MTIDTIKHLGAEFHRAADSLADTLARLDNARLERLQLPLLQRRHRPSRRDQGRDPRAGDLHSMHMAYKAGLAYGKGETDAPR